MDKYSILKEALYLYNPNIDSIFDKYAKRCRKITITTELFLQTISKEHYNLLDLGISSATISKLLKEIFPDRVTSTTGDKPDNYLLGLFEYKWCGKCKEVLPFNAFRKNTGLKYGLNTYCKQCHADTTSDTQAGRQSKYRCAKLNRTPSWANLDIIKEYYAKCPAGMHVDHIYPLQGELVSGLHVIENLRYLSAHDNCAKGNKYTVE